MKQIEHNVPFQRTNHDDPVIALAVTASTGTATLQIRAGELPASTWVDVTDGSFTNANGELTFWAPIGATYRVSLTGDAAAYATI